MVKMTDDVTRQQFVPTKVVPKKRSGCWSIFCANAAPFEPNETRCRSLILSLEIIAISEPEKNPSIITQQRIAAQPITIHIMSLF